MRVFQLVMFNFTHPNHEIISLSAPGQRLEAKSFLFNVNGIRLTSEDVRQTHDLPQNQASH